MGLPVISFLVIGPIFLPMHAIGQSYYSGYFPPHQQASYFQPYQGSPFSDARHIRRPSFDNNPFQDGSLVKRNTVSSVRNDYKEDTTFSGIDETQGRLLSPSAFNKISETLGALNTVGHFIVDMTRGQDSDSDEDSSQSVPDAILTLTKTVLGQNVTKTIEPLIKRVGKDEETNHQNDTKKKRKKNKGSVTQQYSTLAPIVNTTSSSVTSTLAPIPVLVSDVSSKEGENRCITPDGRPGRCEDLSSCPALLLDLGNLRESLCFKSLFVPGVCCPTTTQSTILTTQRPVTFRPTTRPLQSLVLLPQIRPTTTTTTTERYPQPPQSPSLPTDINSHDLNGPTSNNIIDPDDCGQQEYSSGRIVGGVEAPNGQWPWMAAIFLHGPKRTEFWCGGSLIGSRFILTAAHCTRDSRQKPFASKQFTVRLGDIDLSTDTEPSAPVTFNVIEVRAHERFSRVGFYNDVAILVLDRPVRKSKYVIPVCLPRIGHTPPRERLPGRRATVVGWGTTYYGGKESTVQRQADLPIWRNEDCDRAYFQPITDNFLCAGYSEGGVDACQGDSGGPLMMRVDTRWTQLGIVSFGNKCGEPGYPGVYTRISEYIDWINEHTRD